MSASRSAELTLYTGQIFVTVTPDKTRPFTVRAGNGVARALGTAFGVRQDQDGTHVVVTESTVRVSGTASGRSVDVHAGQQVDYSPQRGCGEPKRADLRVLTAWRSGQMIFEGRPLGDVVAEMSRYRWGTIVFADASLKQLLVTGIFDTSDTDGLLDAIATVLPVKIHPRAGRGPDPARYHPRGPIKKRSAGKNLLSFPVARSSSSVRGCAHRQPRGGKPDFWGRL